MPSSVWSGNLFLLIQTSTNTSFTLPHQCLYLLLLALPILKLLLLRALLSVAFDLHRALPPYGILQLSTRLLFDLPLAKLLL